MALIDFAGYPATMEALSNWSFSHAVHHRDIIRRIGELDPIAPRLDEFVLDPFNPLQPGSWAQSHAVMHRQYENLLNIESYMLDEMDWQDPESMQPWLSNHWISHNIASRILGV